MPELVIDDSNGHIYAELADYDPATGERRLRGRIPRDYSRVPYGACPYAAPFDLPLIPRGEWQARCEEMERTKSRLSDLMRFYKVPSLDQNGTNYCWTNGVVTAMYAVRALNGLPHVDLSSASVAAPIKGFRNVGGWGAESLEYITQHGVAPASLWPPNAISRQYDNEESRAARKHHVIGEWYELQPRNLDQLITCLLLRIPVAVGFDWWGHEVCAIDPVWHNGAIGTRIRNSWGPDYGDSGFAILQGNKQLPDDAVCPRVVTATPR